jgi:uncharacterized protein
MNNSNHTVDKGPPVFNIMAKPIGPVCNLNCTYCFYLEKEILYPEKKNFAMSGDVLESFIRQKIEAHRVPQVNFAWQGGEPTLLGVDFFRQVVNLQNKYMNGKKIENALQTNGILLNDEWCEFFKENDFLIGLSIDGPESLHNRYRLNKGGKGTFKQVMKGIEYLKKHDVRFNTLTVMQRDNSYHPLDVYHFLKEISEGYMQFIPIVERISGTDEKNELKLVSPNYSAAANVSEWSVEPLQFGTFLCDIFNEWVRQDVGKYFVQLFDIALEAWMGMESSLCVFKKTCGQAMIIEHNGDLYSCDHFVYPENKLGNIMDSPLESLVNSEQQVKFAADKLDNLPQYCLNCEVRFACHGECPKHRFIKTPDGEEGLNYLCAGYKKIFHHIDPYMKFMANELQRQRAPANVMAWAAQKDKGFPAFNVGRNDLCPCGSGKKYKKCCEVNV